MAATTTSFPYEAMLRHSLLKPLFDQEQIKSPARTQGIFLSLLSNVNRYGLSIFAVVPVPIRPVQFTACTLAIAFTAFDPLKLIGDVADPLALNHFAPWPLSNLRLPYSVLIKQPMNDLIELDQFEVG